MPPSHLDAYLVELAPAYPPLYLDPIDEILR